MTGKLGTEKLEMLSTMQRNKQKECVNSRWPAGRATHLHGPKVTCWGGKLQKEMTDKPAALASRKVHGYYKTTKKG